MTRSHDGAAFPALGDAAGREIAGQCPFCGLLQSLTARGKSQVTVCRRCGSTLRRPWGKSMDLALACAAATLLLLVPAAFEPFLTTTAFGVTRTSVLPSSASDFWSEGWPLLCIAVLLFVLVFPALRCGFLCAVLGALRLGRRAPWAGVFFRIAMALETWAMLDVFLLGMTVAYARLHATVLVTLQVGGACFVAAAILSLITRATLDPRDVWRRIAPDVEAPPGVEARGPDAAGSVIACSGCGLLAPASRAGRRCPRCAAVLQDRRPRSVMRASALLVASLLLYLPANLYPIATIPIGLTPTSYTVFGGIVDLTRSHLAGLALLVFCASFAVPILKIAGLAWCTASAARGSHRRLVGKTRAYRFIEELGRWSMVDPFTIGCFVPVVHFNSLIDGRAEAAATPFAAVVILTTLAVKLFDPRLLWDVARRRPS